MRIEPFAPADIAPFLAMADQEGWVADAWECEFLLRQFPEGCFTARDDNGAALGFVTSLRHADSGWIGNLIIAQEQRRRGLGDALFCAALTALYNAGTATIWLTASAAGAPLYERHGFTTIDTIHRWVGSGRQRHVCHGIRISPQITGESRQLDERCWGDVREKLLEVTTQRGVLLHSNDGFLGCQPCRAAIQCGPFAAHHAGAAAELFAEARARIPRTCKVLLDAPAANRDAQRLYRRTGMRVAGSCLLMYAGKKPAYRPELLYGLATMGSCG